jgi:hypothetical protein
MSVVSAKIPLETSTHDLGEIEVYPLLIYAVFVFFHQNFLLFIKHVIYSLSPIMNFVLFRKIKQRNSFLLTNQQLKFKIHIHQFTISLFIYYNGRIGTFFFFFFFVFLFPSMFIRVVLLRNHQHCQRLSSKHP